MDRPSKKEIKEAIAKLKDTKTTNGSLEEVNVRPTEKKDSRRIRKQGI